MKIVNASYEFITEMNHNTYNIMLQKIAETGRICYKSERTGSFHDDEKFIRGLVQRGHEAMLEHCSFSVKFTVDRGVSHELVRHRIASFAQESTRYCNYSKDKFDNEITFIKPCFFEEGSARFFEWKTLCKNIEHIYLSWIKEKITPQEARSILPNSLKTEIIVTMNIREWRHFFNLRALGTTGKPHPQMLEVTVPLFNKVKEILPVFFEDMEIKNEIK